MKVSVIIPVYNTEPYLRKCFDSLVNQTYKDIELIIINDGSTDNSIKIIEEYAEKYSNIKFINQQNQGYSGARNTALEYVTGEYVGFVDSDDYIALDMFEKLIKAAQEKNADIVSCSFYRIFENNQVLDSNELYANILNKNSNPNTLENYGELLLDHGFVWNRIYKTELLKSNNIIFPKDICFGEDTYFHRIALLHAKNIFYLKEPLYFYLQNRKGGQTTLKDRRNLSFILNCEKLHGEINKLNLEKIYPWFNHLVLSLCSLGYERISKEYQDEYYLGFRNLIDKFKKPFKLSYPDCKNCNFMIKARYAVLKFLHPMLYFGLKTNSRFIFNLAIYLRLFFQNLPDIVKRMK